MQKKKKRNKGALKTVSHMHHCQHKYKGLNDEKMST